MSGEAPGEAPEVRGAEALRAFGRHLHRERELRGLSRDDVVRATRLAPGVVEALESGDPARLPARGYLFGYLRSYAGAVGLDPDDVVLRFQEVDPAAAEEPAAGRAPVARRGPARRTWLLLAAALAVAALLATVLALRRGPQGPGEPRGRRSSERAPYPSPAPP